MESRDEARKRVRIDAEVDDLVHCLRSFGVLTRHTLCERAGGAHWTDHQFEAALKQGVRSGRIRKLADGLYELGEGEQQ